MNKLKRNCVISAVGESSLHREWIKGNPDFDLHLIVYDNSYNEFYNDTNFITYQKGYKLRLVYNYLQQNPEYLERYDYLFFPDDDLLIDSDNISELFKLMDKHHLQITQPALSDSYYSYEHIIRDKFCVLHYTNFVEIMAPCFSREALNKVLFTFNANDSGWGLEIHWPHLIGFTGKEIAIIDEVRAIHTRPIQSFSKQNMDDFNEYISKYKLKWEILETGCILKSPNNLNVDSYERLVTSRETYKQLNKLLNEIADCFVNEVNNKFIDSIGLQGLTGKALFLANYSRVSEKRKYLDSAFSILEITGGSIAKIKNDLSFQSGLPGFSWYIEYLAQLGFIENNTDEILEEVCEYLNKHYSEEMTNFNIKQLMGLAQHYLARITNNANTNMKLKNNEKEILISIIDLINKWSEKVSNEELSIDAKSISDCILLLHEVKTVFDLPEINFALKNLIGIFKNFHHNSELPYFLKAYIIILASQDINDIQLKNKVIQDAINYKKDLENIIFQQALNLYLLHKIYLETKEEAFKKYALEILDVLIDKYKNEPSYFTYKPNYLGKKEVFVKMDYQIRLGLILISILSDKNIKLDSCIL